jgi:ABC-2 type transport system permease protein
MREVAIVMRREFKSYWLSPIAYVFGILLLGVHLYLVCMGSDATLAQGQTANAQAFFGYLPLLFVFFVPALTMRLWAEERKLGTLELLLTFPVKTGQLIAGKFFAALAYLGVILLLTLGFPLTLEWFADLDWGPVVSAYLATLLMASAYLALGMFFSSITRDQIVALLIAMVALFLLYYVGHPTVLIQLEQLLPDWVVAVIGGISPNRYFTSITRGVIDTGDLIYYACFCGFFLYMNALVLQGRRMKG